MPDFHLTIGWVMAILVTANAVGLLTWAGLIALVDRHERRRGEVSGKDSGVACAKSASPSRSGIGATSSLVPARFPAGLLELWTADEIEPE